MWEFGETGDLQDLGNRCYLLLHVLTNVKCWKKVHVILQLPKDPSNSIVYVYFRGLKQLLSWYLDLRS